MSFHLSQLVPLLTCLAAAFVSGYIWSRRKSSSATRAFLLFNAFVFSCCLNEFFLRLPLSDPLFTFAARAMGPLLVPLAFLYMEFVRSFVSRRRTLVYWLCTAVNVGAALFTAFTQTIHREFTGTEYLIYPDDRFMLAFLVGMVPLPVVVLLQIGEEVENEFYFTHWILFKI